MHEQYYRTWQRHEQRDGVFQDFIMLDKKRRFGAKKKDGFDAKKEDAFERKRKGAVKAFFTAPQ